MSDTPSVRSWRAPIARDVAIDVQPRDGEAFSIALTPELERLAEYARRIRTLLTARHRVDADTACVWLKDAQDEDARIVDFLARLDAAAAAVLGET